MFVDVRGFHPSEIKLSVSCNVVEVRVCHEDCEVNMSSANYASRTISKIYRLPRQVVTEKSQCSLSNDGTLILAVPWLQQPPTPMQTWSKRLPEKFSAAPISSLCQPLVHTTRSFHFHVGKLLKWDIRLWVGLVGWHFAVRDHYPWPSYKSKFLQRETDGMYAGSKMRQNSLSQNVVQIKEWSQKEQLSTLASLFWRALK